MPSLEERVASLEAELREQNEKFIEAIRLTNLLGGSGRVFQAATLTLVAAYPNKKEFREVFLAISERMVASALASYVDEDHLQAIEAARTLVLLHLDMQ